MTSTVLCFAPALTGLALQAQPGAPGLLMQVVPFVIIFAIFWLLVLRPMRKRQEQHQSMVDALERGAKVITNGGLYGEVTAVDAATVLLKVGDNVKVRVAKSAVASLQGEDAPLGGGR